MTTAAAARVSSVRGAVIDDLECARRKRLLERAAQLRHRLRAHCGVSEAGAGRASAARLNHSTCRATNAKVSSARPKSLKYTQVRFKLFGLALLTFAFVALQVLWLSRAADALPAPASDTPQ